MAALLAFITKYLPMIVAFLSAISGLFTGGQAIVSHFELQHAAAAGLAAGNLESLYTTHVYGNGAATAGLAVLSLILGIGCQGHISNWKTAYDQMSEADKAAIEKIRRLIEAQEKRATVVEQVHDLPAGELAKVVDRVGHQIADTVKRLAGA